MAADPLDVLLQVRRVAVDEARSNLTDCLTAESIAADHMHAIEAEIATETATATALTSDDAVVEAFARWLQRTLPRQRAAADALLAAEIRTKEARAVLAASRAGVRAIELMLERRAAERQAEESRREQAALDEVAQRAGPEPP